MALQFIYGPASYDHNRTILNHIKQDYHNHHTDFFFYLVPNHIKFNSEVNTLKYLNPDAHHDYAQINVQILSFTRLAWFFLSRIPHPQHQQLSDSGINMLLYKIIQNITSKDHAKALKVFRSSADQPGFISKLASQINEMKTGQLSPQDLDKYYQIATGNTKPRQSNQSRWNPDLSRKMHDFIKIYRAFEKDTQHRYLGKADVLATLCHAIQNHQIDLSHYHFYLSGFSQFTAQESKLAKLLILHSKSVLINLDLDSTQKTHPRPNLFYKPARLYYQLCQFARKHQIKLIVNQSAKKQRVSDDLLHLDNFWTQINQKHAAIQPQKLQDPRSIQIIHAPTRYLELSRVALMIRQLVATKHYRYSDFLILTRHLDKFKTVIRPIFKAQTIPIFVDLQKSMDTHPLVQLLNALFSIYDPERHQNDNYQYTDVMNLLKTELLIPKKADGHFMNLHDFRDDLALTENWVLKTNYRGSEWTKASDWQVINYHDASDFDNQPRLNRTLTHQINVIHQFIRKILPPFYRKMHQARNGTEAATVLYQFLVDNGVLDRLKIWQKRDANPDNSQSNDLTAANEIGQVWKVFCQLLDDFVKILGNRPFNLQNFRGLLRAGFEGAVYSQIPSTLDQVVISESRIVQTADYKVVFMIGSTDEVMPDKITNNALFSDEDRTEITPYLTPGVQYLNDDSASQMANEPFLNYLAFMSATQRIIFTYSLNNDDDQDKKVKISPYVKQIKNHFKIREIQVPLAPTANAEMTVRLKIKSAEQQVQKLVKNKASSTSIQKAQKIANDIQATAKDNQIINFVGSKQATLRHLVQAACNSIQTSQNSSKKSRSMDSAWYYLYYQLADQPLTDKLLGGLTYNNQPQPLTPRIVTQLYGNDLNTSISQLEQFYQDPYEYFLKYGLRLKERDVFGLTPIETGLFYHKIMEEFVKTLNQKGLDLQQLTPEPIEKLVQQIATNILNDPDQPQYRVLTSSNRMAFIRKHLIKTVERMLLTMQVQSNYTKMRPQAAEIPFGIGKSLEVPPFKTGSHHINVRGRIDRIDAMKLANQSFFSVVDYKSSPHKLNYGPIYYGDELQMMTYLDILYYNLKHHHLKSLNSKTAATLAGVLYAWIHTPKLKARDIQKLGVQKGILKSQKYHHALLINDSKFLNYMEPDLANSESSLIYPIKKNKDGQYSQKSSLIKLDNLKLILQRTRDLIIQAGRKIYQGDIRLYPAQFKNRSKLKFSPYRPIMQFDPLLSMDQYHQIPKMNLNDLVERLKQNRSDRQE